jgi:hypothetical protein
MSAEWIEVLRAACTTSSQSRIARQLGYSGAVVSQVLSGTYAGDLQRVQAAVEGALMNAQVDCPVLGLIGRARCVEIQRRPFTPTNPANVALYRACRNGCPHSFLPPTCRMAASAAQPAVAHNTGSAGTVSQQAAISHGVTAPTGRRKRPTDSDNPSNREDNTCMP